VLISANRGAVLIDFNISSEANSPVVTRSKTPGYLPPNVAQDRWEEDVDLFQLGVTLLQVAVGQFYDGENLAELRTLAEAELEHPVRELVLRLSNPEVENGFASASAALRWLQNQRP
jgi:serine/threonine-protein kinase